MDSLQRAQIKTQLAEDRMAIREGFQGALVGAGRAERERLRWILKADRAELWRSEGARNMAQFLSAQAHISNWKARRMIEAAYALESLPLTGAALESGSLSLDKVVELARFVTPADESRWVSWARRVTTGGVRDRAEMEVKRARDEAEAPEASRSLTHWRERDHVFIQARLSSDEGERVITAIDKLAAELPAHPDDAARAARSRVISICTTSCTGYGAASPSSTPHHAVQLPSQADPRVPLECDARSAPTADLVQTERPDL